MRERFLAALFLLTAALALAGRARATTLILDRSTLVGLPEDTVGWGFTHAAGQSHGNRPEFRQRGSEPLDAGVQQYPANRNRILHHQYFPIAGRPGDRKRSC